MQNKSKSVNDVFIAVKYDSEFFLSFWGGYPTKDSCISLVLVACLECYPYSGRLDLQYMTARNLKLFCIVFDSECV